MADVMQATQSSTNTMPVMGSGAHEVNPHGITPTPKSVMKLLNEVMREFAMRMAHSVSRVASSSPLSDAVVLVVEEVESLLPVLRASVSVGRCRHSNPTIRARK